MAITYDRRAFLKNSALMAVVPSGWGAGHGLWGAAEGQRFNLGPSRELAQSFTSPPDSARPWVYWFVSDGNITREGITADLEAMHRVGIRGLIYMEVDEGVPRGAARFLSPQWRELMQHAMKEATRLGITIDMNNDGGWCGSGGPWITPELSMQTMVWSETHIEGPTSFAATLPQPKTLHDYYRDIAVLAFPTPPAEQVRMADCSPKLTCGADRKDFEASNLTDGNSGTLAYVPMPEKGQPQYLNIEFEKPFTAQALTVAIDRWEIELPASLEVSENGRDFRRLRELTLRWPSSSVNFEKVNSRHFRIVIEALHNRWYTRFTEGIPLGQVELHPAGRIEDIPGKAAFRRMNVQSGEPALTSEMVVRRGQVIDISEKMDAAGRLSWDVPSGKWTVLRLGHTTTGKMNHPAPQESLGLECDKLSKKAAEVHFEGMVGKLLADQAAVGAKALTMTHIDSWEIGSQNWTPGLREVFMKRYGYDLFPYLPTLTGRGVESREVSERFLWDLRRLVADLTLENYAEHMKEISHRHGLTLSIEGYDGVFDEVAYGGRADMPTGEFWMGVEPNHGVLDFPPSRWVKEMASSGHVYGRPVIAAEAFTAFTENAKWQNYPFQMKLLGDWAFAKGINRFVFHRYSMQPWLDRKPGMTMGPWGVNYERTNTWWELTGGWHDYLARCQFLLQQGRFVADIARLGAENSPYTFPNRESFSPPIPAGYDYDDVPAEALLQQATVRDGRLVLESGMSYRLLVLSPARTMRPALLRKIKELVVAGLTVLGPRPGTSPSLADYPRCDEEVSRLADELWGECDGVSVLENRVGQGKVTWGRPLVEVLHDLKTLPDLTCQNSTVSDDLNYIHRRVGEDDVYFVASAVPEARRFLCNFRVTGKRPELWWPDTGRIEPAAVYDEIKSTSFSDEETAGTFVPLALDPYGSVFVVFRAGEAPQPERVVSIRRDNVEISGLPATPMRDIQLTEEPIRVSFQKGEKRGYQIETWRPGTYELKPASGRALKVAAPPSPPPVEIRGPWELEFPKGLGAPSKVTLPRLISWTAHSDAGVRHFSGTATYRKKFELPTALRAKGLGIYLDFGRLCVIAEAQLNGRDLGILWKPPFRVDVTDLLRVGANDLVVHVANLWPNRLIGDEQLPSDREWPEEGTGPLKSYPKWLLEDKPSPAGRVAFTTWKVWTKDDALLESGLLGPVTLQVTQRLQLDL